MNSLELCNYKSKDVDIHVHAYVEDAELSLKGQDLGKSVDEFWGDDEYEYFYSLSKENTEKIYQLLKADSQNELELLQLVKLYFSDVDGCKNFREYCEKNNIIYNFFSI